ncbi:hypothetical protein Q8A73_007864 [Channa argus]|nr:hypothetical protein Q8A73_007864 [Channa argus]
MGLMTINAEFEESHQHQSDRPITALPHWQTSPHGDAAKTTEVYSCGHLKQVADPATVQAVLIIFCYNNRLPSEKRCDTVRRLSKRCSPASDPRATHSGHVSRECIFTATELQCYSERVSCLNPRTESEKERKAERGRKRRRREQEE